VPDTDDTRTGHTVGGLASEVLGDLYRAVCGRSASAIRAYDDDDALLLLLRFEPEHAAGAADDDFEAPLDAALLAMPSMVASAVLARSGRRLAPGNVSVCAERGLAVFAFSAIEDPYADVSDDDLFRIDSELFDFAGSAGGRTAQPVGR